MYLIVGTGEVLEADQVKMVDTTTLETNVLIIRWTDDELQQIANGFQVCDWCPELRDPDAGMCQACDQRARSLAAYVRRTNLTTVADYATLIESQKSKLMKEMNE